MSVQILPSTVRAGRSPQRVCERVYGQCQILVFSDKVLSRCLCALTVLRACPSALHCVLRQRLVLISPLFRNHQGPIFVPWLKVNPNFKIADLWTSSSDQGTRSGYLGVYQISNGCQVPSPSVAKIAEHLAALRALVRGPVN